MWLVCRHGESSWNARGVIHGTTDEAGLSDVGRQQAELMAERIARHGTLPDAVLTSPLRRAMQTAGIIAARLGREVRTSTLVREVGAGALEGVSHARAAQDEEASYRVWRQRGDLDAIPGAETGDRVQARAVAAILLFGQRRLAVVTHAAIMRCLVNTAWGRPRRTPVSVAHDQLHVLSDDELALERDVLTPTWRPTVTRIRTGDGDYLAKELPGVVDPERFLSGNAYAERIAPQTQWLSVALDADDGRALGVRRFVSGEVKMKPLASAEIGALDALVKRAVAVLHDLPTAFVEGLPMFTDDLRGLAEGAEATTAHRIADLLAGPRIARLLATQDGHAVDIDFHRENLLFDGGEVTKIDNDSLCRGPRRLALSAAIVGGYLLDESDIPVEQLVHRLDRDVGRAEMGDVVDLMRLRALYGRAWFEQATNISPDDRAFYLRRYDLALSSLTTSEHADRG